MSVEVLMHLTLRENQSDFYLFYHGFTSEKRVQMLPTQLSVVHTKNAPGYNKSHFKKQPCILISAQGLIEAVEKKFESKCWEAFKSKFHWQWYVPLSAIQQVRKQYG